MGDSVGAHILELRQRNRCLCHKLSTVLATRRGKMYWVFLTRFTRSVDRVQAFRRQRESACGQTGLAEPQLKKGIE